MVKGVFVFPFGWTETHSNACFVRSLNLLLLVQRPFGNLPKEKQTCTNYSLTELFLLGISIFQFSLKFFRLFYIFVCGCQIWSKLKSNSEDFTISLVTEKTNITGVLSRNNLLKAYNEWLLPLRTLVTGIMAESHSDYDEFAVDTVCTLNPLELVLYRCIELVDEKLKQST